MQVSTRIFLFSCSSLIALCCQSYLCRSLSSSSFLSLSLASLFSRFTHTLALTLAFLTVEITIITSRIRDKRRRQSPPSFFSFFLSLLHPPHSLTDPSQNPRGLFYSRLVSNHLRPVDGTVETLGGLHRVIITAKVGETSLEN